MMRHSRDRYAVLFGTSLVAFTFFLVIDIQSGLNLRAPFLQIPESFIEPTENSIENDVTPDKIANENHYEYQDVEIENDDTFANFKRNIGFQWVYFNLSKFKLSINLVFIGVKIHFKCQLPADWKIKTIYRLQIIFIKSQYSEYF